ncbi:MAG TPA: hypothetical protein ENK61_03935 [Devosia sp.]|nr:hypothetical protein [Devosia sp.]
MQYASTYSSQHASGQEPEQEQEQEQEQDTFVSAYYTQDEHAPDHPHTDQEPQQVFGSRVRSASPYASSAGYAPVPEYAKEKAPQSEEADIWTRRAMGHPYDAPATAQAGNPAHSPANSLNKGQQIRPSANSHHRNNAQPGHLQSQESFVSQLKRRLNQNAPG